MNWRSDQPNDGGERWKKGAGWCETVESSCCALSAFYSTFWGVTSERVLERARLSSEWCAPHFLLTHQHSRPFIPSITTPPLFDTFCRILSTCLWLLPLLTAPRITTKELVSARSFSCTDCLPCSRGRFVSPRSGRRLHLAAHLLSNMLPPLLSNVLSPPLHPSQRLDTPRVRKAAG